MLRNHPLPSDGQLISGKFRIVRQLGAGGMGVVFEAVNEATDRRVALKFLSPALSSNAEPTERFKREAKAAARIHHPNVVAVQDFGEHEGRLYLVLELLEGRSLREWLLERSLNFETACRVLLPIMRGVAAAHAVGVLHRDLKPDNVFMTDSPDGLAAVPKVLDFGLAKLTSSTGIPNVSDLSATGMAMGTYQFMAPEQLRAREEIDERADVYAVGAILFNMVTGGTPYRADNPVDLAIQIIGAEAPDIDSLVRVPAGAAAVVARALARDREARYRSIEEFAIALEPFTGGMLFRGGRGPSSPPRAMPASGRPGAVLNTSPLGTPFPEHSYDDNVYPRPRRDGVGKWLAIALGLSAAIVGTSLLLGVRVNPAPVSTPVMPRTPARQGSLSMLPAAPSLPTAPEPGSSANAFKGSPATPIVPAWPDPWGSTRGNSRSSRHGRDERDGSGGPRAQHTTPSFSTLGAQPIAPPASIESVPFSHVPAGSALPADPPAKNAAQPERDNTHQGRLLVFASLVQTLA